MKTLCSAILLSFLAQGPSSVGGVVQDPAGAALDAASVSILSARGSVIETVRTGPDGRFLFSPIRPGNYELSIEAAGFATKSQAVRLLPDRALQLKVRLNLQALSQEVTVTAELGSVAELARTPQQVTVIDKSEIDRRTTSVLAQVANDSVGVVGIPLIVNTSSGIMNTDSGHREHSPERSDGLASQFIPSESRFSLF